MWFNMTRKLEGDPEAQPQHLEWRFGPETTYRLFLQVGSGGDPLTWVSLQDKYEHRVRVPSMTSLLIQNLTREDSGQYRAQASFTGGRGFTQVFQLSVYGTCPLLPSQGNLLFWSLQVSLSPPSGIPSGTPPSVSFAPVKSG